MSKLPNLWVWNGAYGYHPKFPCAHETSARVKPLDHGRNELYIPAARLRELLDKWRETKQSDDTQFVYWLTRCAAELEALLTEGEK